MTKIILAEEDIIKTYPKRNQNISFTYLNYLKAKEENQNFGYKKLSKLLNKPMHTTRYWHHNNAIPQPVRTVNWLKEKALLPLTSKNQKILLIAKILGATFGDGGIFENLNGIFLSSSELEAVKEFGEDLIKLFGRKIEINSRIIEGGEYGHSWCYQNTNRNIIRLFQALGAPIGRKSEMELKIPDWIFSDEKLADNFFSSFFGGELGTPSIHKNNNQLTSIDIGLQTEKKLIENKTYFLKQIEKYLNNKGIRTGSISISDSKECPNKILMRLQISKDLDNFYKFVNIIKLTYCKYKQERLNQALIDFINLKYHRYRDLLFINKSSEETMRLLNLTQKSIEIIKAYRKDIDSEYYFEIRNKKSRND